jgi:hypothetical protein
VALDADFETPLANRHGSGNSGTFKVETAFYFT